jgi:hypothetical protein
MKGRPVPPTAFSLSNSRNEKTTGGASLPVVCLVLPQMQPSADQSPGRPAKIAGKPTEKAHVKPVAEDH